MTGRGVVLTVTAEEEGLSWSDDVAVTEWKVKQRIVTFSEVFGHFTKISRRSIVGYLKKISKGPARFYHLNTE